VDAGLADLDAKRAEQVGHVGLLGTIPPRIDWENETIEDIDRSLGALWHCVQLGPDLRAGVGSTPIHPDRCMSNP
jgi:hypothetical protein